MNIASLLEIKKNPNIPQLAAGDTVKVHTKIIEGEKERIQVFQGTVIRQRHGKEGIIFTVRHVAYGVGVERTFPSISPLVEKVEVIRHGKVRRAKLYYLRGLSGKASRIKERRLEEKGITEVLPVREQPPVELAVRPEAQQPPAQPAEAQAAPAAPAQQPAAEAKQPPATQSQTGEAPKA